MDSVVGKTCPFCQFPVKSGDEVRICSQCGTPHHASCWRENGGCTTYGCRGQASGAGTQNVVLGWQASPFIELTHTIPGRPTTSLTAVRYAGFWPRFAAYALDGAISVVALLVISALMGAAAYLVYPGYGEDAVATVAVLAFWMWVLVNNVYLVGTRGQSVGRMAVGIMVIKTDNSQMTYAIALWRLLLECLLAHATIGLFYLSVATHPKHQGWHDRIMNTAVIYAR